MVNSEQIKKTVELFGKRRHLFDFGVLLEVIHFEKSHRRNVHKHRCVFLISACKE